MVDQSAITPSSKLQLTTPWRIRPFSTFDYKPKPKPLKAERERGRKERDKEEKESGTLRFRQKTGLKVPRDHHDLL
ncbi:unnamed protein product [Eruca vesicaria subsp. sativa]|uniref:Uncharacterized protein n=1 Tax=Eruca vesicaria subsp. sativa TaxID=29727 RepID=A0ABC8LLL4_ERUVS|nr:unnamed protein product [Eruca vesicaria subsp. sativa]